MVGRGMGRGGGSAGGTPFGKSTNTAFPFNVDLLGHGVAEFAQPPPVYPPLVYPPLPLESTDTDEYLLALNRDFLDYLKESPFYFQPIVIKNDIERYSDKYQTMAASQRRLANAPFEWSRFPRELHPQTTKKRKTLDKPLETKIKKAKIEKNVSDITNRLEELERKEEEQKDQDETEGKGEDEEEGEERESEEIEGQEEDIDEEMDLGTDYMNNYFDNGETYLEDEDENLEDGPIY